MTNATIALEEAAVLEPPQPDKKRKKMDRSGTTPRVTAFRYALLIFSLAMVLIPVYVLLITSLRVLLKQTRHAPGSCLRYGRHRTGCERGMPWRHLSVVHSSW